MDAEANPAKNPDPFAVKDCALAAIATGERAQNLRELRDKLALIHPESVYYHFWGGRLRPRFDSSAYMNDFATWAAADLRDLVLAERLSVVDPTEFPDLEGLRQEVLEIIEERLDEVEMVPWAKADHQFYFVRSQIVVFDTRVRVDRPEALPDLIPNLSEGSVFYHFIDARRRTPKNQDDLSAWIAAFPEHQALAGSLVKVDPYFSSLTELRREIAAICRDHFQGGRP